MIRVIPLSLLIFLVVFVSHTTAQDRVDFSRDIQPILSENCYFCHGPDANQREADLRLDVEQDAGHTIEPNDAENSELFRRINSTDADELMPPADSNRQLTRQQIELLKRWIDEGATWKQHWAFTPIRKQGAPSKNKIDFFVERRLANANLTFSPMASPTELVRRVSLDLTGLPPSLIQIDQFLADKSDDAYEKMVDRFLASPAYGERMAWDWLDAARYADTNGYQGDNERTMWPWRDWVIRAYNQNMPFDQFSIWQLAGDLLPNATDEQILATGFNRNHPINGEGGRIPEENRIDYVMDMAETTGTVWLGLTFNCCRCHDHKYDQLSQNDYYSFFAFFNQTPVDGSGGNPQTPPVLAVPSTMEQQKREQLKSDLVAILQQLDLRETEIADKQPAWEQSVLEQIDAKDAWEPLKVEQFKAMHSQMKQLDDGSLLSFGPNPENDNYHVDGGTRLTRITAVRIETLADPSMTNGGLARSNSSNFVLTDFSVSVKKAGMEFVPIKLTDGKATFSQANHDVGNAIDQNPKTGWAVYNGNPVVNPQEAIFKLETPLDDLKDAEFKFVLKHESEHKNHNIGRFRLSMTGAPNPELFLNSSVTVDILRTARNVRSEKQRNDLKQAFLANDERYATLLKQRNAKQEQLKQLDDSLPKVMVMGDQNEYRKSFRLDRGSYESPLNEVSARTPGFMQALPENVKPDRLALARWLFDDTNPLTARVTVNRLWAKFFGVGLVKTPEDFGVQGERPTHPELLDWLAAEFRESDWNTKQMIRLILNSHTYKQSSRTTPQLRQLDPNNRLLARGARFRLPSWMIRDQALAASGRLVNEIGGAPVNTYQPGGVWEEASFGNKKYKLDAGDDLYRRSIYTFWRRIAAPTMFFDNSDRLVCSVKSLQTNTPLHALGTLNDVAIVEASRILATQALALRLNETDTLNHVFRRAISRLPKQEEADVLMLALNRTREQFRSQPEDAKQFLKVGDSKVNQEFDTVDLASWTSLCLAIFNLDEALTRQ